MHYLDYNEKKEHGTKEFPAEYYYVDEQNPQYNMPFHWHWETELIRIKKGQFSLTLNDSEITAQEGDLIYIEGGVIHGGTPEHCVYECLVFSPQALLFHNEIGRQYLGQFQKGNLRVYPHFTKENPKILSVARHLFHAVKQKTTGKELLIIGSLFSFYGTLLEENLYCAGNGSPALPEEDKIRLLKPVLEYIETHYSEDIRLETLSQLAGISPKYFCRYFKRSIHRTPIDYLNYYRVDRACFLLLTSGLNINEISYRCGFHDCNYFVRTFKKYKGVSPMQFRKNTQAL